ncbi:GIDE domain-containing protein [endosymbiont of Lamellibrachia barhami]|uniref:GIDE domain-containing protein n=1 Tax=endosymbiont of Lamellibrachia barhami TaxID=205975 RepID=UPI0015A870C9|nr:GIDE domain-containing protein [endosymbiont of Lamellibrachia barhami]
MSADLLALPTLEFWVWAGALSLLSLAALFFSFRNLAHARTIEDTPTSRIRSAHQGYVELNGEAAAMKGEPIITPLTHSPCCWFRFKIERRGEKGWRTVRQGGSEGLFLLKDESGECIVDPDGAAVTPSEKSVWYGSNSLPQTGPATGGLDFNSSTTLFGLNLNIRSYRSGGHYRYTEETIYPGDPLYAIGLFKSFGEADRLAMRQDMVRERLRQWKQDRAGLLARFDRDGNGAIDMGEWESARRKAEREVASEQLIEDHPSLHTLSQPDSNRPFIISSNAEFALVKRYRRFAFGFIAGFFLLGGVSTWMLATRFAA